MLYKGGECVQTVPLFAWAILANQHNLQQQQQQQLEEEEDDDIQYVNFWELTTGYHEELDGSKPIILLDGDGLVLGLYVPNVCGPLADEFAKVTAAIFIDSKERVLRDGVSPGHRVVMFGYRMPAGGPGVPGATYAHQDDQEGEGMALTKRFIKCVLSLFDVVVCGCVSR